MDDLGITITEQMKEFLVYRGLHVLCTINKDGKLTATHYAVCLCGGCNPMWGVWTSVGKFLRFSASKSQVEMSYPKLVWRRAMCQWSLNDTSPGDVEERRAAIRRHFDKPTEVKHLRVLEGGKS